MWAWLNDHRPWLADGSWASPRRRDLARRRAPPQPSSPPPAGSASARRWASASPTAARSWRRPSTSASSDVRAARVRPTSGYRFVRVSWAGNVWAPTGINEAGLAVNGGSSTPAVPDQEPYAMPWHMTLNPVLRECATTGDAIALLARWTSRGGHNRDRGRAGRRGAGAEVRRPAAVIRPERDVICGTNHYTTPVFEDIPRPVAMAAAALARLAWMRETFIEHPDRPAVAAGADRGGAARRGRRAPLPQGLSRRAHAHDGLCLPRAHDVGERRLPVRDGVPAAGGVTTTAASAPGRHKRHGAARRGEAGHRRTGQAHSRAESRE